MGGYTRGVGAYRRFTPKWGVGRCVWGDRWANTVHILYTNIEIILCSLKAIQDHLQSQHSILVAYIVNFVAVPLKAIGEILLEISWTQGAKCYIFTY